MPLASPLTHLAELGEVESALHDHLAARSGEWASEASALPGWTRAHVIAHLAGNAEGLARLTRWAASGAQVPMYPSPESRAAEIERRAALPWPELVGDLESSATALSSALHGLREPVAERSLRLGSGASVNVCDLAAVRIREVLIHRVDLADDYHAGDWPTPFTTRTLDQLVPLFRHERSVPARVLRSQDTGTCWEVGADGPDLLGRQADLMAWLLGRPGGAVETTDGSATPTAPAWV